MDSEASALFNYGMTSISVMMNSERQIKKGRFMWILAMFFASAILIAPYSEKTHAEDALWVPTTVCAIRSDPAKFINKQVLLRVHYETDSAFATFITDEKNGMPKCILEIQSVALMKSPSVVSFFRAGKEICQRKHEQMICSLYANLDVEATILAGDDKVPFADFKRVISFNYH